MRGFLKGIDTAVVRGKYLVDSLVEKEEVI